MTVLDPNWVTWAPEGETCQRCEGKDDVLALKFIFDVPRYLCVPCIEDAEQAAHDLVLAEADKTARKLARDE